jgi:cytochrome c oxidase subunit 1
MPLVGYGLIFNLWWAVPGVILIVAGIYGWAMEPSTDPDGGHGHDDHHGEPDDPEATELAAPETTGAELVSASAGSTGAITESGDSQ